MNEKYGVGQPVTRFEDPRLLRGEGRYVNDLALPGMAHVAYVRSPHARARIAGVDAGAALAAPGVLGVYTVEDMERDGIGTTTVSGPMRTRRSSSTLATWWAFMASTTTSCTPAAR